jgi:hypothetical protein
MKIKNFYRGGSAGEVIKGLSACDIIDYETKILGNNLNVLLSNKQLKLIKSNRLLWLCKDKRTASEYGEPEAVFINNYRIIARDNFKGFLIEVIK